ncbi:MAG: hypothetical protein RR998_04045 [Oscillospiraceae bacterium]
MDDVKHAVARFRQMLILLSVAGQSKNAAMRLQVRFQIARMQKIFVCFALKALHFSNNRINGFLKHSGNQCAKRKNLLSLRILETRSQSEHNFARSLCYSVSIIGNSTPSSHLVYRPKHKSPRL